MTKAVIFYTNGTSHKFSFNGYSIDHMQKIVTSNILGYSSLEVDHYNIWLER
jgi:hypothetical protein